jgi:hypothetical protein
MSWPMQAAAGPGPVRAEAGNSEEGMSSEVPRCSLLGEIVGERVGRLRVNG